jgi:hypothetical protein
MNAQSILTEFSRRGITLRAEGDRLIAKPLSAVSPELREAVRRHKAALLAHLRTDPVGDRATWTRSVTPDSRHPLIPPEVRAKIENIEADARAKGWPPELLYNVNFWDSPRGLAAVLDLQDEIVEVTSDHIAILKTRRDLLKFRRHAA